MLLPLALAAAATATPAPFFSGPAFADGPYNSVLGALGSGDKALLSQDGVLTRLYSSPGAQGSTSALTPANQSSSASVFRALSPL